MGARYNRTKERLDKIVHFILTYQAMHNGDTPEPGVIERENELPDGGWSHYRNTLENDGRIHIIGKRPLRLTIAKNHAANRKIAAHVRGLALQPVDEAAPAPIPAPLKADEPTPEPIMFVTGKDPVTSRPPSEVTDYAEAREALTRATRAVKPLLPSLLKTAETRDLMFELINRGYLVAQR